MYKKSEKCACNTSLLMTDQQDDYFVETRDLACHSRKKITSKFIKISSLINTFCILLAAGNSSAWAHGGGGFHGGWGGGFHGQGGFEWGNNSRESAGMYHRNNNYSAWGASGGYRESEHYRGLGGSSYGTIQPFQEHHLQTIHPFNQASSGIGHIDGFHHGEYTNKEFSGNANWINHNNWHSSYWHGSYWHGSYWHGSYWHGSYWHGSYWTGGTYWGARALLGGGEMAFSMAHYSGQHLQQHSFYRLSMQIIITMSHYIITLGPMIIPSSLATIQPSPLLRCDPRHKKWKLGFPSKTAISQ
ncbi:hypothetical protein [Legionella longbeachae]|uniref:hypothetical protein n=1 Tax=Legionella longbeachae TaxID=450 RepID=UPI001FB6B5E8|nr:hypothetical protein [Legionella longbeachae]